MTSSDEVMALVRELERGETDALGTLFVHFRSRLYRMIQIRMDQRLQGRVDTSDVLQEVFLDAQKRVQHYLNDTTAVPFYVWLRSIAGQTLIDLHRRHLGAQMRAANREISCYQTGPAASSQMMAIQLVGQLTSPSRAAIRSELIRDLMEAFESMNETDREILMLRHFEELTNQEVAEILKIEQAAASVRYIRALKRLRHVFEKLHPDDPSPLE